MPAPCNSAESCVKALVAFTPEHWRHNGYGDWMPARVARVGGAAAVPALRRLLTESKDERVREAAARSLELLGSAARPAIDDLIRAANDGNDYALRALVDLAPDQALPVAAGQAWKGYTGAAALLRLGEPGQREAARMLNTHYPIPHLIDVLRNDPAAVKTLAADILIAISKRRDVYERVLLARMLALDGPPEIRPRLRAALQDLRASREPRTIHLLALPLALAGDREGIRRVGRQLGEGDGLGFYAYDGFESICTIGAPAASLVPKLSSILRHGEWEEQAFAAKALGCIGVQAGVPALLSALRSPSHPVVVAAVTALEKVPPAKAVGPLTELARTYWHPGVRAAAEHALAAGRGERLPGRPAQTDPPSEEFACYGEDWPRAATRTVVVDPGRPGSIPTALGTIDALTSYLPVDGGWLATANKGEFGGGLYFVSATAKRPTKIGSGNFHYVAERPGGLVAVEGLWHLVLNHGSIWRIDHRGTGFSAAPWIELPGTPRSAWQTAGDTLIVASDIGPIAIDSAGHLRTGDCHSVDDEMREVLQSLLDDARLFAAFTSRNAPMPLRVGLWRLFQDARGLSFRGRPVITQRESPPGIEAGTYLEIIDTEFEVAAGKAQLDFAYPDLALAGRASFTRATGRWALDDLRLGPLTDVPP